MKIACTVTAQVRVLDDKGEFIGLAEPEKFIEVELPNGDLRYYDLKWLQGVPGLRNDQLENIR